jgi:hypothetical protein
MTKRKPTIPDLMIITGVMLLFCAIPVGIVFAFGRRPGVQTDWQWQIISGGVVMIAVGFVGGVFLWIGDTILRRRWKREKMTQKDVS